LNHDIKNKQKLAKRRVGWWGCGCGSLAFLKNKEMTSVTEAQNAKGRMR
jgi:hypothetical protein